MKTTTDTLEEIHALNPNIAYYGMDGKWWVLGNDSIYARRQNLIDWLVEKGGISAFLMAQITAELRCLGGCTTPTFGRNHGIQLTRICHLPQNPNSTLYFCVC